MLRTDLIKLPLEAVEPLFIKKLQAYVEWFDFMDEHGGWFPYPDSILDYFKALGVTHWADLYFRDGAEKWLKDREPQRNELFQAFAEAMGSEADINSVNEFLVELAAYTNQALTENKINAMMGLEFLDVDTDISPPYVEGLSSEERQKQHDVWINQLVLLFNDLSIAAHGESIFNLVDRAINNQDDDALVRAVQIDRSLLPYFQQHLIKQSMKGNSDFLDSLSYRINNPPRRGTNNHPLLWILLKDMLTLCCLNKSVTSTKILDLYHKAVGEHPKFGIVDDQIVRRQRRKFNELYRQVK